MLKIQEYLLNNSIEQLTTELGIKTNRHTKYSNLINFCYSQIDSPYYHPIVKEARGIILDESDNWNVVAYPFNRFYSVGEGGADNIDWYNAKSYIKYDGSLIILYNYNGEWNIATKGTPDGRGKVGENNITYNELAWQIFDKEFGEVYYINNYLNPNYTYMFELCSPFNRVIVPYIESRLTLIGVRDNKTLKEKSTEDYTGTFFTAEPINLTLLKLLDSFENLDGLYNEGYVIVDNNFNRVKLKHPSYISLSNLKGGTSTKRMIEIIRNNEGSEFLSYFPEYKDKYDSLSYSYWQLSHYIDNIYYDYKHIENDKEFALAIKDFKFKGILFSLRKQYINSVKEGLLKIQLDTLVEWLDNPTSKV